MQMFSYRAVETLTSGTGSEQQPGIAKSPSRHRRYCESAFVWQEADPYLRLVPKGVADELDRSSRVARSLLLTSHL